MTARQSRESVRPWRARSASRRAGRSRSRRSSTRPSPSTRRPPGAAPRRGGGGARRPAGGRLLPPASTGPLAITATSRPTHRPSSPRRLRARVPGLRVQPELAIFDFGKTPALVRQRADQLLAAQREAAERRGHGRLTTSRQAYFNLEAARAPQASPRRASAQFESASTRSRASSRPGTRVPYDLTKAQVDLGNASSRDQGAGRARNRRGAGPRRTRSVSPRSPSGRRADMPLLPPSRSPSTRRGRRPRDHQPWLRPRGARREHASDLVDAQVARSTRRSRRTPGISASGLSFPLGVELVARARTSTGSSSTASRTTTRSTRPRRRSGPSAPRGRRPRSRSGSSVRTAYVTLEDGKERLDLTELTVDVRRART